MLLCPIWVKCKGRLSLCSDRKEKRPLGVMQAAEISDGVSDLKTAMHASKSHGASAISSGTPLQSGWCRFSLYEARYSPIHKVVFLLSSGLQQLINNGSGNWAQPMLLPVQGLGAAAVTGQAVDG